MANPLTFAIIKVITQKGKRHVGELKRNCANARKLNNDLLMQIISDNKDTEFGKLHDFANIKTVDDYKKNVPFTSYDDYAPYIDRMVNHGEKNLITAYPVIQYAETSGSVGVPKKIPVSQHAMDIYTKYTITRVSYLADRWNVEHKGKHLPIGRGFNQLETIDKKLPDGTPLGSISGSAAKAYKNLFPYYLTSPIPVLFPPKYAPLAYLKARYA